MPFILREFRIDHPPYKSISSLRTPQILMLAYRTAQIMHGKGILVIGFFILPTHTIIYKMIVFTSYMIVKHGQEMDNISIAVLVGWAISAATFWVVILVIGGTLHLQGNNLLMSWKYHTKWPDKFQRNLMNKFRKSCKPFELNYGRSYVIKRLTVLKFIRSLSRGIFKALLAL